MVGISFRNGMFLPVFVSASVNSYCISLQVPVYFDVFAPVSSDCGPLQVPAYFDENQKDATITAGKIAGLQTVRLIRQCPT